MLHENGSSGRAPARAKPALSIRARVLVLVALAIAPLLFDRIRLLQTERADRIAAASQEAISLARRGIEAQQQITLALYAAKRRGRNTVVAECPDAVALAS